MLQYFDYPFPNKVKFIEGERNNFKIKKVHIGQEFGEDFQDDDDIEGFPFELYTDNGDLADYIYRTVSRIKL